MTHNPEQDLDGLRSNVEKCKSAGILGAVRSNLGAKADDDTSYDHIINQATTAQIMGYWTGWEIGDRGWGRQAAHIYEELSK